MVRMQDVADRAGVSLATVSLVLNDTKPITPATRARVEAAIAELGFRPNVLARGLAGRRTRIFALAYPALERRFSDTALMVMTGAAEAARERGYHLVMWPAGLDGEELTELLGQGLVDGVVLMEVLLEDPRVEVLQARRVPFSIIGRTAGLTGIAAVDIDFGGTVDAALEHLGGLGHEQVALVTVNADPGAPARYGAAFRVREAFAQARASRGRPARMFECAPSATAGREIAGDLISAAPDVTAVIVMNEAAVHGIVSGFANAGRAVPEAMSVVSVATSSAMAGIADPILTIMESPGAAMGRHALASLLAAIDGATASEPLLVPCTFVPGESTAPPRD